MIYYDLVIQMLFFIMKWKTTVKTVVFCDRLEK